MTCRAVRRSAVIEDGRRFEEPAFGPGEGQSPSPQDGRSDRVDFANVVRICHIAILDRTAAGGERPRKGPDEADLPRSQCDHAGRSGCPRGHASVLERALGKSVEQPWDRAAGAGRRRAGAWRGRFVDRRAPGGDRLHIRWHGSHPALPRRRSRSPSRALLRRGGSRSSPSRWNIPPLSCRSRRCDRWAIASR